MTMNQAFGVSGRKEPEGEAPAGGIAAVCMPGEPNSGSLEAIREGDAFLSSGKEGRYDNGADLIAAAMR